MRAPVAAGTFYPSNSDDLKKIINSCFTHKYGPTSAPKPLIAAVVPHAGYIYSGPAAAWVYHNLKSSKPGTVIILGPNHTGFGSAVSASAEDSWKTPLGEVQVDEKLRKKLADICDEVRVEDDANVSEHSIEVQLPFLQTIWGSKFKILPICLGTQNPVICRKLGEAIGKLNTIVLASSDMSHYVPQATAEKLDKMAIEKILELDPAGLFETVVKNRISMCGVAPAAAMLWAVKSRAKKADLLKYYTSGDIIGDKSAVVGYAAIAIR